MIEVVQGQTNKVFQANLCTALNYVRHFTNTSFTDYSGIKLYNAYLPDVFYNIQSSGFGTLQSEQQLARCLPIPDKDETKVSSVITDYNMAVLDNSVLPSRYSIHIQSSGMPDRLRQLFFFNNGALADMNWKYFYAQMMDGRPVLKTTAQQSAPTKQLIYYDRRLLFNTPSYSSGVVYPSKFTFLPLLADIHLIHNVDIRNMRRVMCHVSGHSTGGADGKATLPEGWYTSKVFGSEYFAGRFECSINQMVT